MKYIIYHGILQDIYVVFTLVLMVTMTFWNGIATLLDANNVDFYDTVAMWLFIAFWLLFSAILATVVFFKVYAREYKAPTVTW